MALLEVTNVSGTKTRQEMYQMIADTLTILTTGGETYA